MAYFLVGMQHTYRTPVAVVSAKGGSNHIASGVKLPFLKGARKQPFKPGYFAREDLIFCGSGIEPFCYKVATENA
jgi:hypothetical protein